jgi:phosphate transport system protein
MTSRDEHIVSSYDRELTKLDALIDSMAGLAEFQLEESLKALSQQDSHTAHAVLEADKKVDDLQVQTEAQALRVLALRSPVADDLRRVITALKIAGEIERIADVAANCAKRSLVIHQSTGIAPLRGLISLGKTVQSRLKSSFDAYRAMDVQTAQTVRDADVDVDSLYSSLFREILTYMMEDPRTITAGSHLLFVAKNLERIGDHATNIAEETIFLVTGKPMDTDRPKGDTTTSES